MESSLTAVLMKYGSDIQLKEKQKEILEYVYQGNDYIAILPTGLIHKQSMCKYVHIVTRGVCTH